MSILDIFKKKVNKADVTPAASGNYKINTQYSNEAGRYPVDFLSQDRHRRGINVYSTSQILQKFLVFPKDCTVLCDLTWTP